MRRLITAQKERWNLSSTLLVVVTLLAACTPADNSTTEDTTTTQPPPATTSPVTTTTTTAGTPPDSPCLVGDRPFSSSGVISAFGGATGDAAQISGIRSGSHPGCERVVVDLLTADGAPAGSLGLVGVEYREDVGIIRINLPEVVSRTAVADTRFDGDLADRAYVVHTREGHLAIDIHVVAGAGVALRAFEVDAPSRIVVDLRPDANATAVSGGTISDAVVLLEPSSTVVATPLTVSGYARTAAANVVVRLHAERDSSPLTEVATTAADWLGAWGEFQVVFTSIPQQPLEVFVGVVTPRNSNPVGAWVTIDASPAEAAN